MLLGRILHDVVERLDFDVGHQPAGRTKNDGLGFYLVLLTFQLNQEDDYFSLT